LFSNGGQKGGTYAKAKMEMEITMGKFSAQKTYISRKFAGSFDGYVK
jgi:hypothetical protein